ncbi:MAG: PAS domain-containing protein [Spirulinaceae cyanobacterium]
MPDLNLYRKTLAALPCGVAIVAVQPPKTPIVEWNRAFEKLAGYNPSDAINQSLEDWLTENQSYAALEQLHTAIATASHLKICIFIPHGDRPNPWVELELIPLQDKSGQVTHLAVLLQPIEMPQNRLQQEHQYRILADNLPDGLVLLFDQDYRYTLAAGKGLENSNLTQADIEGKTLYEVFPAAVVETFENAYQAALQGKNQTCEYEYNNRAYGVHVVPTYNEQGQICGGMVTAQDITEQKQTEHQLRSLAEREKLVGELANRIRESLDLSAVMNTAVSEVRQLLQCDRALLYRFNEDWSGTVVVESHNPDIVSILDLDIEDQCFRDNFVNKYKQGRISAIHDVYAQELTPCHREMLETMQVRANLVVPVLHNDQLWGLLIAHHCTASRTWETSEMELLRQLSVQLAIAIRQAANAEQLQAELQERSRAEARLKEALNELRRTQSQLIQHEKMSSLGQMVAGIAHEINNPISFIAGNIAYAAEYANSLLDILSLYHQHHPEPHKDIQAALEDFDYDFVKADFPQLLESMKMGTERIRQIVISLRNFSRLDEAERKAVNLHDGLENTLALLKSRLYHPSCPVELIKDYGDLPDVECYPGQLNQVFMNIIENAIDALEEQKQSNKDLTPQLHLKTYLDRSDKDLPKAVICIRDNGIGIPEKHRDSIFDPFFTTKPVGQGTGLGLSISYQIVVQKHEGTIQCNALPEGGTEFEMAIPLHS